MPRVHSRMVTAVLAVLVGGAYALSLTHHVTEDAIKYVRESLVGGASLFHPHHLFYHGFMAFLARLAGAGIEDIERSVRIMQLGNVVLSVAAVLVFHAICRRVGAGSVAAGVLALLFGLASAFFEFASQVEVYNGMALFSCLTVLGLLQPDGRRGRGWMIGLGYFLAMGFHQVGVFLGLAILVHEWRRGPGWRRRILSGFVAPLAAIGASYAIVGWGLGHRSLSAWWNWVTLYGHMPYWGLGRADTATVRNLVVGIGKALVDVTHVPNGLSLVAGLGLGVFVAVHFRGLPRSGPRAHLMVALAAWLTAYGLFMAWWDAANVESWIIASVPCFTMVAILVTGTPGPAPKARRVAWTGLALCLGVVAVADGVYVRHDRGPNWAREAAMVLRREAQTGDVVVAIDTDKGAYYELYLLGRGVAVEPINFQMAIDAATASAPATFTDALVDRLAARAQELQQQGVRCFVDRWVERGEVNPIRHMRDFDARQYASRAAATVVFRPVDAGTSPLVYEISTRP